MARQIKSPRGTLTERTKEFFPGNIVFRDKSGRLTAKYAPLGYSKEFKDSRRIAVSEKRPGVTTMRRGGEKGLYTIGRYGASYKQDGIVVMKSLDEVALQLEIAAQQSEVALENWKTIILEQAYKFFDESFDRKSWGGKSWPKLAQSTINKRIRRGTWPGSGGILEETGALRSSLELVEDKYKITTKPITDYNGRYHSYAGVHNNPDDVGSPLSQRQFIGHNNLTKGFIEYYQDRWLFDSVFRTATK